MKAVIDACVLYPTVLREIVIGLARTGYFTPLWSYRILEEWARAAARIGQEGLVRGEVAALRAEWPEAEVAVTHATEARIHLPDPNDVHVLAAAVDGGADELLTLNLRDFPRRALAAEGIVLRDPDGFLVEALDHAPDTVAALVGSVLERAAAAGVEGRPRTVLKRAKLPRLGKRLDGTRARHR